ncbi:F-actin-monooxygenase Mical isoform X5 [Harmonia axyridis]|uniref:F-actin-monooxygenase Mical isoform X5 n=1 Tax=Harmonia axyridis TaxID=115357 RepID=UPI001E278F4E|nr:F-actin-monooxygenase Mical isoform X5 [Harmonia axyridis]
MFHGDARATNIPKVGTTISQAQALEYFEQFINATTLKNILGYFRTMCELLHMKPTYYPLFYPKLKAMLNSWKAKAIWKKLDSRANHKCYGKGKIGEKTRVLVIGGGPCGLRTAIEAQLLGCKVVVVEKRDRLSRNNVLHLWPFVIEDLRALGAKKFFGKFCAGAIDHISIRQLQCILLKLALILGVEIHTEVSFESLIEPNNDEKIGWRAELKPSNHPVSQYEFDVIIGADGKRNTLTGFKRKEFRGKLAIAITANFINKRTEAEARVEEISGVAFIFNQKFFKDLYQETGIDLENIVYYKDETHYFVMTAKKPSLIEKGVILQDLADTERLLAPDNVNREALLNYAKEAADFSTNYQMSNMEFAVNHYGQPDVAMFDFTSMYAAENASRVLERKGYQLLTILVGDSLLEPFWPTGSGCARGFLSSLDAAWAIRSWSLGKASPLEVLAERESIYRLLAQTTPDNLNKDWKSYTLDPSTRYPNLNRTTVSPHQLVSLYDTDDIQNIEKLGRNLENVTTISRKRRREIVDSEILIEWVKHQVKCHPSIEITDLSSIFHSGKVLCAIINHYRPDLIDYSSLVNNEPTHNNQLAIDVLEKDIGIPPIMTGQEITSTHDNLALTAYLTQIYDVFRTEIPHVKHPKLELPESKNTVTSFKTLLKEPSAVITPNENFRPSSRHKRHIEGILSNKSANIERKTRKRRTLDKSGSVEYDTKLPSLIRTNTDDDFAAKIKSIEEGWQSKQLVEKKPKDLLRKIGKIETSDWNIKEIEKKIKENKLGKPIVRDKEKVPKWSREQFVARQTKLEKLDRQDSAEGKYADIDKNIKHLDLKLKEGTNRDLGHNKIASITERLTSKIPETPEPVIPKNVDKPVIIPSYSGSELCHFCNKRVYLMERLSAESRFFHHGCFKCQYCKAQLRLGSYAFDKDGIYGHKFFCLHHYGMQGKAPTTTKVVRKPSQRDTKLPSKKLTGVSGVDLLDRVRTPERAEFSNLSRGSSDQEDSINQMDEDEWTDRNFGASTAEVGSSDDDDSSSYSDTDSDDEDAYEEAMEEPATKEGTLKWAERMSKRHFSKQDKSDSEPYGSSDSSSYYENSSDEDESDTATEGEEEIRARELRLQEVRLDPPIIQADTGTDTEVLSDDNSSDVSSEVQNSATEISTDSEFAHDDPTPTSEVPPILLNDMFITKNRGSSSNRPKKIQVTSGFLQKPSNGKTIKQDIELKLTPLVSPAPSLRKITSSIKPPSEAYALNRTQSTGGIATKVSLELKKKYLLGESVGGGSIQKSGSASTLDTKLKSFCSNISDCQKLLKPASEISPSMQTFCKKLDENISPILSPLTVESCNKPITTESNENQLDQNEKLPPPDLINVTITEKKEETVKPVFENETEGRPRSPLHETSLIVPEIDWSKVSQCAESLSSSSTSSSSSDEQINTPNYLHGNIPTVRVCAVEDSEGILKNSNDILQTNDFVKSISSDKKQLNQPKTLPGFKNEFSNDSVKKKPKESGYQKIPSQDDRSSGCSTPISMGDDITTAFTETELSDWARDGCVSDDLEGVAFDLNGEPQKQKLHELPTIGHICGKMEEGKDVIKEPSNTNFDSIEYMDTCTESNSEEGVVNSIAYNILKNEEIAEDSLNPIINDIVEAQNTVITESKIKNSGYCIIATDNNNFGGEIVNLKPADIENLKQNQQLGEREEDSLLVVETTTEENTCSDSTVKNVTEIPKDTNTVSRIQKQRLEEKLSQLKKEKEEILLQAKIEREIEKSKEEEDDSGNSPAKNIEFDEHCQRLQSKIDFGNVKDSIDIRKSRRKSKDSPQKPELIQEEKQCLELKNITLNLSPTIKTPDQIYNKEVIEKERNVNQRLVQEMVMSKMRAENKAFERKVRNRPTTNSLNNPFQLSKSATTDIARINKSNLDNNSINRVIEDTSGNFLLKEKEPIIGMCTIQKSQTSPNVPGDNRIEYDEASTPIAPPRSRDLKNSTNKLKSEARARARMLSNEELGLSPEDKILRLREKSRRYERSASVENSEFQLYPMTPNSQAPVFDTLGKKRPISEYLPKYSENRKSFSPNSSKAEEKKLCRSDSNLFRMANIKNKEESPKKGTKFTKIMDLFSKKSPKGLFSKISPKSKDMSKSCPTLFEWTPMTMVKACSTKETKNKDYEIDLPQTSRPEVPPPVPPLPLCYTENLLRRSEDSSDDEFKCSKRSSLETLAGPANIDDSVSSLTERHSYKKSRRSVREAQLKRHRMAQEIQRKLEETEVKTKELEEKGVLIEKALRGEDECSSKQESELLQEWFDIMRDRTELRRYEKELMVRAQELELEDRHARLQHQLRKRLKEENKSEEDKDVDYKIINEMLEIVSKRDSLIALLEEDRLRYLSEDRDFEEQMLAKDLHLTPKWKTNEK